MNHDGKTEQSQGETVSDVSDTKRSVSSSQTAEQPTAKRMKVEPGAEEIAVTTSTTATQNTTTDEDVSNKTSILESVQDKKSGSSTTEPGAIASGEKGRNNSANANSVEAAGTTSSVDPKSGEVKCDAPAKAPPSNTTSSEGNIMSGDPTVKDSANVVQGQPKLPLKALRMSHLQQKYSGELEYMLREFRKLERQLLGAKGATQIEESAGSRERREKLHSFILHLEDTIQQIELGCKLETEGKSTVNVAVAGNDGEKKPDASKADSAALSNASREKEEEKNVQKLEEHILANLLPVKVRLKKQLAAQQGATKNPAGMPARRGYPQPSDPDKGKGTFAAAAEQRRKEAEKMTAQQNIAPSESVDAAKPQFGNSIGSRGSSLTQKLHGQTLGSKGRPHGHGVGLVKPSSDADKPSEGKARYGGNPSCSAQAASRLAGAAVPAHKKAHGSTQIQPKVDALGKQSHEEGIPKVSAETNVAKEPRRQLLHQNLSEAAPSKGDDYKQKLLDDPTLTEEEKEKLRRKMKKKKLIMKAKRRELERQRHAALQPAQSPGPAKGVAGKKKVAGGKNNGKKRGPRTVEYICALCSETYNSVSDYNPWWALSQHACPKCGKSQIPRIDIGAPANAIEYHPALLSHAEDNNGGGGNGSGATPHATDEIDTVEIKPTHVSSPDKYTSSSARAMSAQDHGSDSDLGSELSDITDGNLSDISLDPNDSDVEVLATMTPAEKAEHERFGQEYSGPKLSDYEASRLLILMLHANGCPCRHKNVKQRDVCRSTKFMMLHVRDCPGTTSTFDVCPFPWCRKVKHLLYHLVSCNRPETCAICSPSDLSKEMKRLVSLNQHRLNRQRERMLASMRTNKAVKTQPKGPQATSKKAVTQRICSNGSAPSKPKASKIRGEAQSQPVAESTNRAKMKAPVGEILKAAASPAPQTKISDVDSGPPATAESSIGMQAANGKSEVRRAALCSSTGLNTDEAAAKSNKTVSTDQLQLHSSSSGARGNVDKSEHAQATTLPGTKPASSEKGNDPIGAECENPSITPALANRNDSNASETKEAEAAPKNIFNSATQVVTSDVAASGESEQKFNGCVVKREDDNSADETIDSRAHSSTDTPVLLGETEANSKDAVKDSSAKSKMRDLQASALTARKTRSSTSVIQNQEAGLNETKDTAPADVETRPEADGRREDQTSGDADTGPTGPKICSSNSTKSVAQVRVA